MLRKYADYKKAQINSQIYLVSVKESINLQLESLRMDLVEAVRLPELLFEGSMENTAVYHVARREDFEQNTSLINEVIDIAKSNLYDAVVEAAVAAASDPLADFEAELINGVSAMIDTFKAKILGLVNAGRAAGGTGLGGAATGGSRRGTGGPSAPAGTAVGGEEEGEEPYDTGAPMGARGGDGASMGSAYARGRYGPSASRGGSGGRYHPVAHDEEPSYYAPGTRFSRDPYSGFRPADYGNFKPSDGIWGGVKRLLGSLVPRKIRQIWHAHPGRPMRKEHSEALETLFIESATDLDTAFDQFKSELVQYIQDRVKEFRVKGGAGAAAAAAAPVIDPATAAAAAKGDPVAVAKVRKASAAAKSPAAPTGPANVDIDSEVEEHPADAGADPAVTDPASGGDAIERRADAGDGLAQAAIDQMAENIRAACKDLGIPFVAGKRWGAKGQPRLSGSLFQIAGLGPDDKVKASHVARAVFHKIYEKYLAKQHPLPARSTGAAGLSDQVAKLVVDWFGGIPSISRQMTRKGQQMTVTSYANFDVLKDVLSRLGAVLRKGGIAPDGTIDRSKFPQTGAAQRHTPCCWSYNQACGSW